MRAASPLGRLRDRARAGVERRLWPPGPKSLLVVPFGPARGTLPGRLLVAPLERWDGARALSAETGAARGRPIGNLGGAPLWAP